MEQIALNLKPAINKLQNSKNMASPFDGVQFTALMEWLSKKSQKATMEDNFQAETAFKKPEEEVKVLTEVPAKGTETVFDLIAEIEKIEREIKS